MAYKTGNHVGAFAQGAVSDVIADLDTKANLAGANAFTGAATFASTLGVTGVTTLTGLAQLLAGLQLAANALSGTADAIPAHASGFYAVTKAGVDSMTLAAPTATTDDGKVIFITSTTANAHTITGTGAYIFIGNTSDNATVLTFTAHAGACVVLIAYQAKWYALAAVGVTATS